MISIHQVSIIIINIKHRLASFVNIQSSSKKKYLSSFYFQYRSVSLWNKKNPKITQSMRGYRRFKFYRVNNNENTPTTFNIFSRTTKPISTIGSKHPWLKEIQICWNEGPDLFSSEDYFDIEKFKLKSSLEQLIQFQANLA